MAASLARFASFSLALLCIAFAPRHSTALCIPSEQYIDCNFHALSSPHWAALSSESAALTAAWKAAVAQTPEYPSERFAGRGLVITATKLDLVNVPVLLTTLQSQGFTLPVELWYPGEVTSDIVSSLLATYVKLVVKNVANYASDDDLRSMVTSQGERAFQVKPLAILHSAFEEVLFLDADNIPVANPAALFRSAQYQTSGALFWPDFWQTATANPIWSILGVSPGGQEQESGQILVDKRRAWGALNLAFFLAKDPPFQKLVNGDKEAFRLAFRATGTPFAMVGTPVAAAGAETDSGGFCGHTMVQHDPDGAPLFLHHNSLKHGAAVTWQTMKSVPAGKGAFQKVFFGFTGFTFPKRFTAVPLPPATINGEPVSCLDLTGADVIVAPDPFSAFEETFAQLQAAVDYTLKRASEDEFTSVSLATARKLLQANAPAPAPAPMPKPTAFLLTSNVATQLPVPTLADVTTQPPVETTSPNPPTVPSVSSDVEPGTTAPGSANTAPVPTGSLPVTTESLTPNPTTLPLTETTLPPTASSLPAGAVTGLPTTPPQNPDIPVVISTNRPTDVVQLMGGPPSDGTLVTVDATPAPSSPIESTGAPAQVTSAPVGTAPGMTTQVTSAPVGTPEPGQTAAVPVPTGVGTTQGPVFDQTLTITQPPVNTQTAVGSQPPFATSAPIETPLPVSSQSTSPVETATPISTPVPVTTQTLPVVVTQPPEATQTLVTTQSPVFTQTPVTTQTLTTTDPPVNTQTPLGTENPVVTAAPTQLPVTTQTPLVTESPETTQSPVTTQTPSTTETPETSQPPLTTQTPVTTEVPETTQTPMSSQSVLVTETPVTTLSTSPTSTPVTSISPVPSLSPIPTVTVSPKTPSPTLVTPAPVSTPKPTVALLTSPLTPVPTPADVVTQPPVVVPTEVPASNVVSPSTTNTISVPGLPGEFQPAESSQLLRTVKYLESIPGSAEFAAEFNSPTPQNFGGVLQVPKAKDFTNDAKVTIPYQLTGATADLCGPTCTALCQIDDGTPEACGGTQAVSQPGDLSDGYHRVTVAFYPAPEAPAPVALLSTFFTVDTVSPTISIALEADSTESPQVFIDASTGQQTVFITWATIQPFPGYAVASEPIGDLSPDSFNLEGAQIVNVKKEDPTGRARRRALLQATALGGNSSGTVVPAGSGPQLLRVAVNPGNIFDQAGNPIQVTSEAAYVIYYDTVPPSALLQLVNKDPNGVVSLSPDPGVSPDRVVTVVLSFDKRVLGFDATSMIIQNGTLIEAGPNAATADGFSYVLTVVIDPNANLVIQAPADSAYSIVGIGNTASNQLQVLNYNVDQRLQTGVRAAAIASLGVMAAGTFFIQASSSLFINVASSLSLFAARQSLNAPLPTPYIDASSALSFSLMRWPSPFDRITRDSPIPYTDRPQGLSSGVPSGGTNGTLAATRERLGRRLLQAQLGNGTVINGTANSRTSTNGTAVPGPFDGTIPPVPFNLSTTNRFIPANASLINQGRPVTFSEGNISYEARAEIYSQELSVNTLNLFHTVGHNGLRGFLRAVFWITMILICIGLLQLASKPLARLLKREAVPSFLVFPALELTFFSVAIVALAYVALGAIVGKSPAGIVLGLAVLLLILVFFLFVLSILWRHVHMSKSVAFVSEQRRRGASTAWFRAPFVGSWEPVDSEEGDLFRAKYGYFYADYSGRPSELVNIAGSLMRSATRKGAPTTLSLKTRSRRSDSWSPAVDSIVSGAREEDFVEDFSVPLTSRSGAAPEVGEDLSTEKNSDSLPEVRSGPLADVIEVQEEEGKHVVHVTPAEEKVGARPTSVKWEAPLEAAPGKASGKLSRLQNVRSVHRVGRVGFATHFRPGWKMMYLLVVAIEAALLGATHGVRSSYWQVCLIVSMRGLFVIVLVLLKPFIRAPLQLAEIFSTVCELAVVTLALALVVKQDVNSKGQLRRNEEALGYTMIALQLLSIFSGVVNALVSMTLRLVENLCGKKTALPVHF
ncbi:hypothetical protein KFL_003150070 [Klebsormidium nitens]|uniref:Glycosyltransferase family 71 protein n=1 Tax=Klebsormidium nitens TaxID=105231 RepID=A0A1Y1IA59_KLENI|nr:hypothetical protein KFL_003150070 [Klebsormidium nitens]|eukprot:GAQ86842.1 hypothetical protein KFL_003150070 [Klebsormidium nitens]